MVGDFHLTPCVSQKNQLFYFESDAYQAVKLPYGTLVNDPDGETIGPGVPVSDYEWEMVRLDQGFCLSAPHRFCTCPKTVMLTHC